MKTVLYIDKTLSTYILHVLIISDERESVQKKTFQKWVNSHLVRVSCRINDLYIDLRDGKMLMKLLEVLSGERLVSSSCVDDLESVCFKPEWLW